MDRRDGEGHVVDGGWNLFAGQRRRDPSDDLEQPGCSRVHDSRLTQDAELVRRARDRRVSCADERGPEVVGRTFRFLGERADRRQDRSLDRLANRVVRRVRRRTEGACERVHVGRALDGAQRVRCPAHDLGEDHAGVAARAE